MKRGANSSALAKLESAKKKAKLQESTPPTSSFGIITKIFNHIRSFISTCCHFGSKIQESTPPSSSFDIIPNEIFNHVISFLPTYCHFGSNGIRAVCKQWNNNIKKLNHITSQSIIESCQSKEDAINILKDKSLYKNLTFNDYLKIICWIPEMIESILKKEEVVVQLSSDQLVIIGSHSEENFKALVAAISTEHSKKSISSHKIAFLMKQICKQKPKLFNQNIPWDILRDLTAGYVIPIGVNNLNVAEHLYATRRINIYSDKLLLIHLSIAEKEIEEYGQVMSFDRLVQIASYHDKTADALLGKPEFNNQLSFIDEVKLTRGRAPQLKAIFQRQQKPVSKLIKEFHSEFVLVGWQCPKISSFLLENVNETTLKQEPELLSVFVRIAFKQEKFAKKMVKKFPDLLNQNDLCTIGRQHASVADVIISTPKLLSKMNIDSLVSIGSKQPKIARFILKHAEYRQQLNKGHLAALGRCHTSIACEIFKDHLLSKKLDVVSLFYMCDYNPETAIYLLKPEYEFLFKQFNDEDIQLQCEENFRFSLALLKIEKLNKFHSYAKKCLRFFALNPFENFENISVSQINTISEVVETESLTRFKSILQSVYQEPDDNSQESSQRLTHKKR
jgi:hypothetical protein